MNATMSKEEVRADYISSIIDKITFLSNGWARVPSSEDNHKYTVTVENGKATDCACYDCYRDGQCAPHYCKHREAVDKHIARQVETQQAIEVANEIVTEPIVARRCPGCGHVYSANSDCQPGFCLWNSIYTEGLRLQEDARVKLRDELQKVRVHNHFSWRVA